MKIWFGIAAAVLMASSMPAQARFIATDTGDDGPINGYDSPGCASDIGRACNAMDLGFSVDFGNGRTNKIYIYDDGQVTLGGPAGGGGADFGPGSVAATLRSPALGGLVYQTVFFDRSGGGFNLHWDACSTPGSGRTDCDGQPVALSIVPDYVTRMVTFTLDTSGVSDGFFDSTFGYSLGSQTLALDALGGTSAFSFSVPMGVPEPGSWSLMILGFGAAGTALRRRRGHFEAA